MGDSGVTAILDGQQRLTSVFIGLVGSYSEKRKYARREAASSYAKRRLYVNIARRSEDADREYDFPFREDESDWVREGENFWYGVGHILSFKQATDVFRLIEEQGLATDLFPQNCLVQLSRAITDLPLINFFTETDQESGSKRSTGHGESRGTLGDASKMDQQTLVSRSRESHGEPTRLDSGSTWCRREPTPKTTTIRPASSAHVPFTIDISD